MLTLRTLHGVALERDGVDVPMQPKRLLLLAHLLLEGDGRPLARERVIDRFWPAADTERGRNSLRQALFALRTAIGDDVVVTRGQELVVEAPTLRFDARDLLQAAAAGDHVRVAALHRDTFFELGGLSIESPELEQWLDTTRARLRRLATASVRTLGTTASLPLAERIAWLEQLQRLSPHDEQDARRLVDAHLAAGDRVAALEAAQAYTVRLAAELELAPSADYLAYVARVRDGRIAIVPPPPLPPTVADAPVAAHASPSPTATAADDAPATAPGPRAATPVDAIASQPAAPAPRRRRRGLAVVALGAAVLVPAVLTVAATDVTGSDADRVVVRAFASTASGADGAGVLRATDRVRGALAELPGITVASGDGRSVPFLDALLRPAVTLVTGSVERERDGRWRGAASVSLPRADLLLARVEVEAPTADSLGVLLADRISAVVATRREMLLQWGTTVHRPMSFAAFAAYQRGFMLTANGDAVGAVDALVEAWRTDSTFLFAGVMAATNATASGQYERGDSLLARLAPHEAAMRPLERAQYRRALAWARAEPQAALLESRMVVGIEPGVPFIISQWAEDAFYANHPAEALLALDSLDRVLRRFPGETDDSPLRLQALHQLARYRDELARATRGASRNPAQPHTALFKLTPLAALGEVDSLLVLLGSLEARDSTRDIGRLARAAAHELTAHGHAAGAARLFAHGDAWLARHPVTEATGITRRLTAAELVFDSGEPQRAAAILAPLRQPSTGRPPSVAQRSTWFALEGLIAARTGDRAGALRWSDSLAAASARGRNGVETYRRARIAAALGDVDGALRLLSQAFAEGFITVRDLHVDPALRPLRSNPRFVELAAPYDGRALRRAAGHDDAPMRPR